MTGLNPTAGMETNAPQQDSTAPALSWKLVMLRGVLAIVMGIAAMAYPVAAFFAFSAVLAAYLLADGVIGIMSGIGKGSQRQARRWPLILYGLSGIVAGALFFVWPLSAAVAYGIVAIAVLVLWAITSGVCEFRTGLSLRHERPAGWLLVLAGCISMLLGAALLVLFWIFPGATLLSVAWIIGVYAVVYGAVLIAAALRLRREER